mmetsp:Transcript_137689/g.343669  ORF Transcript_137689/g.343669 Transcript_137689/m.343669 type:complete len:274 (+) Transcript_137689:156-977(+)
MSSGRFPDAPPGEAGGVVPAAGPYSARLSRPGSGFGGEPAEALEQHGLVGSASTAGGSGPVLRRKLYDQNLSDWSARYRKNRQNLDNLSRDCDQLRSEVAKHQQEVDERVENHRQLEERYANEVLVRYNEARSNLEMMTQQKNMLAVQLSENRKHKAQLSKERKLLQADFERKHAELLKTAESRDRLDAQLQQVTQQLALLSDDRRRMERELDVVQTNLRANTELADEVHNEIEHVFDGIKDVMDVGTQSIAPRTEGSVSSREGLPLSLNETR